ncbi:ArsR/SmtB family transcription factor [Ornithinibacillus sp. 179-J 7C1 HS]|uniref:ArsR/SmtB family transcription factor n=1 Tax=Ornithinibacillus sp. 179-J 7C1 HS TaxID=3142384 RepID=UPI0039A0F0E7
MASEREEHNYKSAAVIIEHFHSPVVEAIALLSSLVNPKQHEFLIETHNQLRNELSNQSKEFIMEWQQLSNLDFLELMSLFLPVPYFNTVDQFIHKSSELPSEEFLYHFFGEVIPFAQIKELVSSPTSIDTFESHIYWETAEERQFMKNFITNIDSYREKISMLLLDLSSTNVFENGLQEVKETVNASIHEVKALKMEPLNIAQYVMGKTFRRTSVYKMYYFIPSYYLTPHRYRIFNKDICIVIYGCAKPLSDDREFSTELETKLKALSDQNRLLILKMLSGKKEYGAKLAEYLGITTATVSHHLEILKKAGFIKEEKVGNIKYFTCDEAFTKSFFDHLNQFILPQHVKGESYL